MSFLAALCPCTWCFFFPRPHPVSDCRLLGQCVKLHGGNDYLKVGIDRSSNAQKNHHNGMLTIARQTLDNVRCQWGSSTDNQSETSDLMWQVRLHIHWNNILDSEKYSATTLKVGAVKILDQVGTETSRKMSGSHIHGSRFTNWRERNVAFLAHSNKFFSGENREVTMSTFLTYTRHIICDILSLHSCVYQTLLFEGGGGEGSLNMKAGAYCVQKHWPFLFPDDLYTT